VSHQGRLEFLIVANDTDDGPAIEAVKAQFSKSKDELARREKDNEPPPSPKGENGKATFPVEMQDRQEHTYRWAEVGKSYLFALGFNSHALDQEENAGRKKVVEASLTSGDPFVVDGSLYYVRPITDWEPRSKRDRDLGKTRELFVLLRQEDRGKEVTGDFVESASVGRDTQGRPCIDFRLNGEGGDRFFDLTSRNQSSDGAGGFRRHLAIVFDGQVVSAPSLMSPIRRYVQITGQFTDQEIEDCVRILRAGALPARLKPEPVRVTTIEPRR
jgi:hypothetical protein